MGEDTAETLCREAIDGYSLWIPLHGKYGESHVREAVAGLNCADMIEEIQEACTKIHRRYLLAERMERWLKENGEAVTNAGESARHA